MKDASTSEASAEATRELWQIASKKAMRVVGKKQYIVPLAVLLHFL
jgi:hypothetical protein